MFLVNFTYSLTCHHDAKKNRKRMPFFPLRLDKLLSSHVNARHGCVAIVWFMMILEVGLMIGAE